MKNALKSFIMVAVLVLGFAARTVLISHSTFGLASGGLTAAVHVPMENTSDHTTTTHDCFIKVCHGKRRSSDLSLAKHFVSQKTPRFIPAMTYASLVHFPSIDPPSFTPTSELRPPC